METGYHKVIIASLADIANELSSARDWDIHIQNTLDLICEALPVSMAALGVRFGGWKSFSCGAEEPEELDVVLAANYSFFSGTYPQPEPSNNVLISGTPSENTVILPVTAADEVMGVLYMEFVEGQSYSIDDVQALGVVAALLGSYTNSVEATQLEAQARQEAERARDEQVRANEALRVSETRLRLAADATGFGIFDSDPQTDKIIWSNHTKENFGLPPDADVDIDYQTFLKGIHPDDRKRVHEDIQNVLRPGSGGKHIAEFRTIGIQDKKERWLSAWGQAFFDEQGIPVRFIGGTLDITERKQDEQQREALLERERHIADTLQQALIPPQVPTKIGEFRIAVRYRAAHREAEIGGDFYDVFDLDEGRIGLLIGDVVGKGLLAAIQVAAARHTIRGYAYLDPTPGKVMEFANNALCKSNSNEGGIMTTLFAVLDTKTGMLSYANAGHEPPVLARANGSIEELDTTGMMLCIMSGVKYEEHSITLNPGDRLIAITDGITEARNQHVELFGKSGMIEYIQQNLALPPQELIDGLLEAACVFAGGKLQDDAALLAIERIRS